MNSINLVLTGHAQNIFNIQISVGGTLALAYLISLVGLIAVQGKSIFF